MKAIEKDRTRRYDTANGLAADIKRHLINEPVVARPPSNLYRFQKSFRRNRLAYGAASAVVLALIAGVVVSSWQTARAMRAEELTKQRVVGVAAERDKKEKARQEAEAISSFLTEVFQSPDPARDGRAITVAETLDRAVKKLDTDLASQPARRASLQTTIGETYRALGLYHESIALSEKVRDYALATFGPEHPETLNAMNNLAISYARSVYISNDCALRLPSAEGVALPASTPGARWASAMHAGGISVASSGRMAHGGRGTFT